MEDEIQFTDIWTISDAELNNIKASLQKYSTEHKLIDRLIKLYKVLPDSLIKDYPREKIPILQMFWTCFRGFLISIQLILQGHIPESYAITSKSAETVAVAQKFNSYPDKIEVWIKNNKEEGQPFRRVLGRIFPINDKVLQPEIFKVYELTSEHGRHPSFSSTAIYSDFNKISTESAVFFSFNELGDEINFRRNLNYTLFAYHKFLEAFSKIFYDYLTKEWIQELTNFDQAFRQHKETLKGEFEYETI